MVLRTGRTSSGLVRSVLRWVKANHVTVANTHGHRSHVPGLVLAPNRTYVASAKGQHMDTFGSWGGKIDLNVEETIKRGKLIPRIELSSIAFDSRQGKRKYQEDRYLIAELAPDMILAAVFDGHGGSACAEFAVQRFVEHVNMWIDRAGGDDTRLDQILAASFESIDRMFYDVISDKIIGQDAEDARSSGSTATVAVIRLGRQLALAHVGDSRAILCRNGEAMTLTKDHVPTDIAEMERIIESGGRIVEDSYGQPKVNGRLSMSRSLGDIDLKRFGVVALPDTRMVKLKHGKDSFLVLTTDGVCSVMTDQEICDTVSSSSDPWLAARNVNDQAAAFNSSDNATTVIVPLGSWGSTAKSTSIFYSFGRSFSCSSRFG